MANTDMDFAGEHRRQRNPQPVELPIAPEMPAEHVPARSISASGAVFFQQVEKLQTERDDLARGLNEANARIEQFQIAQNDLRSQLETARLELKEANDKIATETTERIRLSVAIEQTIGTLTSHLAQPGQAAEI